MKLSTSTIKAAVKRVGKPKTKTTNYRRGASCEYRARDILREHGFLVIRAAGSHGPFDLWAMHYDSGAVRLIQVKRGKLRDADMKALCAERIPRDAQAELWHFHHRGLARYEVTPDGIFCIENTARPSIL